MSYAQTNQGYPPASGGGQYQPPPQQQPPGPRPPPGMMAPPPYGGAPMMPPPMGQQGPPGTPLVCRTSREPVGIGAKFNPRGYSKRQEGPPPKYLPPNTIHLFEPPPPLEYKPPVKQTKRSGLYSGLSELLDYFEDDEPPEKEVQETPKQRKERLRLESLQRNKERVEEEIRNWKPEDNPKATEDAYRTLFVGRLAYETDEKKLKREMEEYGPVSTVRVVKDTEGKSRGYAFVEFEDENDMRRAYKKADGKRIDGRNIVVDVERGRTVLDWRPRRLGGGIGETRKGEKSESKVYVGREEVGTMKAIEDRKKQARAPPPARSFNGPPDRRGGFGGRGRGGFRGRGSFDNRRDDRRDRFDDRSRDTRRRSRSPRRR